MKNDIASEAQFRIKLDRKLKEIPSSWWESISQRSIRGTPDKIGCVNGRFIGLEAKKSIKGVVSKLQQLKIDRINKSGGYAKVVYPENLLEILEDLWAISCK